MRSKGFLSAVLLFCLSVISRTEAAAQSGPAAWEVGKTVPDTYGYDQNGTLVNLRDYAGKNVVFEVSTAWCYPSFVLAAQVNAAKEYLAAKDVPFEFITVITETPFTGTSPLALRSQGLAWQQEFKSQHPVLSFFNGPILADKPPVLLTGRWLLTAAGNAFPAVAIIGPDQVIKKIQTGSLTADEIVAEFLPDQPPLPEAPVPPASLALKHARVSVKVGKKSGSSLDPFVDASGPFGVPAFQRGNLPEDHTLALSTKRAPQQELWTVHFQGHVSPFDGVPGLPSDKPITVTLSNIQWNRALKIGTLATPTAQVVLNDNISSFNARTLEAPVAVKGGKVVVGPFDLRDMGDSYRIMDVKILWHIVDPSLHAAFLGDYITLQFDLPEAIMSDWTARLRQIEAAVKTPDESRSATLATIDALSREILRYKDVGLPKEGRSYLVKGLARIRKSVKNAK